MALKEMTTVIDCEQLDALDADSVPEFSREEESRVKEAVSSMTAKPLMERDHALPYAPVAETPKSDELEALWPGVHQDFEPAPHRGPSFYVTVGFLAGAIISLGVCFGYTAVNQQLANKPASPQTNLLAMAQKSPASAAATAQSVTGQDGNETIVPAAPSYQVQPGDTLAAIALRNYKRVSPRLLDSIVKANNLRNANVLNLGQKLALPEYHSQAAQVAATSQVQ